MRPGDDLYGKMLAAGPKAEGRILPVIFGLLILVGAAAFVAGIMGSQPERAWEAYLVNFVFWTGLACGSVLFSAVLTITNARWGRPMKRIAEAPGAFLPFGFLLFWVLYFGKEKIFPWIAHPIPEKAVWLNATFLFTRDGLGLLALTVAAMAIIYHSVRRDLNALALGIMDAQAAHDAGERHGRALVVLSPIYGILYAFVLSLLAFDLVMSLSPHWYSTLFGAYYFVGSFYVGLAALLVLCGLCVKTMHMDRFITVTQFHNLGKLLLGFCLMTGDFFYTQFFVIWYGNLPEETRFVITRAQSPTWQPLAWVVLIVCFAFPFAVLLSRKFKRKVGPMIVLCILILGGMWLERLLMVGPSLWKGDHIPVGAPEIAITAGFLGLMGLCVLLFFRRFPLLPLGDPLFLELMEKSEVVERNG